MGGYESLGSRRRMTAVTREELHQIVDWLPDDILDASGQAFLDFLKKENPV